MKITAHNWLEMKSYIHYMSSNENHRVEAFGLKKLFKQNDIFLTGMPIVPI